MLRKIISSVSLALNNIRSNLFHTLLSVLGIVIGVGALVSILSLIDGMEKYARTQITETTSVNAIIIHTVTNKKVNEVRMRKDTITFIDYATVKQLKASIPQSTKVLARAVEPSTIKIGESAAIGVVTIAISDGMMPGVTIESGSALSVEDMDGKKQVVLVNKLFLSAARLTSDEAIGKPLEFAGKTFVILGVLAEDQSKVPQIFYPLTLLTESQLSANPPEIFFEAANTEEIPAIKAEIADWLKSHYRGNVDENFSINTNEARVAQIAKGFLLFRIIMGLIVGISVIVGGIGVMNVLLISVTERTSEIGIRKAMGANRRDIVLLFLSESIVVSAFGSALGLIVGVLSTMAIIPIIKALTEAPFQAAYTLNTLVIISVIAILIGVIFGTYPALRASRLDPVEAIRHE